MAKHRNQFEEEVDFVRIYELVANLLSSLKKV